MSMHIPRATTPTFKLTLPEEYDLSDAANIYATFLANGKKVTKTGSELDVQKNVVSVYLTQEETLSWRSGYMLEIQLNWTYSNGSRVATEVASVRITKQLLEEVLA